MADAKIFKFHVLLQNLTFTSFIQCLMRFVSRSKNKTQILYTLHILWIVLLAVFNYSKKNAWDLNFGHQFALVYSEIAKNIKKNSIILKLLIKMSLAICVDKEKKSTCIWRQVIVKIAYYAIILSKRR